MVKVKFLKPVMKSGILRKPGDVMELPETTAALMLERRTIEVPGKKVVRKKVEVEVVCLVDIEPST